LYDLHYAGKPIRTAKERLNLVNKSVGYFDVKHGYKKLLYQTNMGCDKFDATDSLQNHRQSEGIWKLVRYYVYGKQVKMDFQVVSGSTNKILYRRYFDE
jgi:hypothetical protein